MGRIRQIIKLSDCLKHGLRSLIVTVLIIGIVHAQAPEME